MVSALNCLLVLGFTKAAVGILTQTEANARCEKYRPGYLAVMSADGLNWSTCILPPPPPIDDDCIFGEPYTDPLGKKGCCLGDTKYSFDPGSLVGKCCPFGTTYSWDSKYKVGECCGAGVEFNCKCGAGVGFKCSCCGSCDTAISSLCPGKNNTIYTTGGITFKVLCGVNSFGVQLPNVAGTDVKDCADKCAKQTGCVSSSFYNGQCYPKSRMDSTDSSTGSALVDTVNREYSITTNDFCPGVGDDGRTSKEAGGKNYKLFCGKFIKNNNGLVKPGYHVANLQKCLEDCSAEPKCLSAYYGFTGSRVGECDLVGITEASPTGISADFVAAVPEAARKTEAKAIKDGETCPGLGTDATVHRQVGDVEMGIACGKLMSAHSEYVKPSYHVNSPADCAKDCAANPACRSWHMLLSGLGCQLLKGANSQVMDRTCADCVAGLVFGR